MGNFLSVKNNVKRENKILKKENIKKEEEIKELKKILHTQKKQKKQIKKLKKTQNLQEIQIERMNIVSQEQIKLRDFNDREFYQNANYQNQMLRNLTTIANIDSNTPPMETGRTITHKNETSILLDLYITIGGANPQGITLLTTLQPKGQIGDSYVFNILDYDNSTPPNPIGYNAQYNFNVLKSGDPIPQYNAGPTLAEFGTNQIWSGAIPELRDTFDISCVPAGIGNLLCNNGQTCRDKAVKLSVQSGYTQQQAYNYNVGCQIIPPTGTSIPSGNLSSVSITNSTAPYSSQAITYPLDTAIPKQQTGSAMVGIAGNYVVNWTNPIVSLGNYN